MYYIGVDLGGTSIKVGLITDKGDIINKVSGPTEVEKGAEGIINSITYLVKKVIEEVNIPIELIKAVGVGIPGVSNNHGLVYFASNLFWKNIPLGELLEEKLKLRVFIDNDATVAAVAEFFKGVTRGTNNSIFLTIGTGLGGGLIINKKVYSGSHGIGTEMGHIVIGENFYDCSCGKNGCWETYVSATAMIKYCGKLLKEGNESILNSLINGDTSSLNAKLIFDCAAKGDEVASLAVDRMKKYLAIGLGNLINIFDPEIIAIGGGVSGAGSFLLRNLKDEVGKYIYVKGMNVTEIALAKLGNDAGIIGSGMYAKMKLEE
ncbi:ROK family protein [Alkaliphilus pronyensis]|uniref:ROK family protein n=1 Tax=Alkaliphilus pronyensis TaxID=1482732 RepID=A0A6I0F8K3_9FIRM|nr:ROK family protein [Alkaliphilus pronyensis]KAB3531322.1 ROK family protein [Alkaliphilus pronyensis]